MTRSTLFRAALCLALAACRGGGNGDDTADDAPDAGGVDLDDVSIYDIQSDGFDVSTPAFNIRGVVVVAIDNYGVNKGNLYIMEEAGGAYSGTFIYGAPLDQVAGLAVGDLVDIENVVKTEFALSDDTSGRTTTELVEPDGGVITVTRVGDGTVPAAEVVDALAIGTMADPADQDAEWEKWEGVLIRVENVSINDGLRQIGSSDPLFQAFAVTGPLNVETTMAPPIEPVTEGDCLASVTGIGDYFYDWLLLFRETAEIVTGGTACPEPEASDLVCDNGLDDDADGFLDCGDFSCDAAPGCTTDTTIEECQMQTTVQPGDGVHVTGYVTAIDDVATQSVPYVGFWVADNLAAAPWEGVFVFTGTVLPTGITVGMVAEISGELDEFDLGVSGDPAEGDTITQIDAANGSVILTAGTTPPTPLTDVMANDLKNIVDGEQYEGVLVQLSNMKYTATASGDRMILTGNDGQTIVIDDDVYDYDDATYVLNTTCFSTITGVMSLNIFDDERRLYPDAVTDMVVGTGCN